MKSTNNPNTNEMNTSNKKRKMEETPTQTSFSYTEEEFEFLSTIKSKEYFLGLEMNTTIEHPIPTTPPQQPRVRNANNWVYLDNPNELVAPHLVATIIQNNLTSINLRRVKREVEASEYVDAKTGDVVEGCNSKTKTRRGNTSYFGKIRVLTRTEYIKRQEVPPSTRQTTVEAPIQIITALQPPIRNAKTVDNSYFEKQEENNTNALPSSEEECLYTKSQSGQFTPNSADNFEIFTPTFSSLIENSIFPVSPARLPGEEEKKANVLNNSF